MNPVHSKVRSVVARLRHYANLLRDAQAKRIRRPLSDEIRYESGLLKGLLLEDRVPERLTDVGYRVYSQFDEDGILQYLIRNVPIENDFFVEFGVEDYSQSNTRYLLQKNGWRGVVLDASDDAFRFLHRAGLYSWRDIAFVQSFITKENVDDLLRPFGRDIGILSIDLDGVDYWVWEAVESVSARIVVIEYQPNFGPDKRLTVPYRPDFQRRKHHYSNQCAGASIAALAELGKRKGYTLVGSSGGPNAFFVRDDVLGSLRPVAPEHAYREPRYRDSLDPEGNNTFVTGLRNKQRAMADGIVVDLADGREKTVAEALGLE